MHLWSIFALSFWVVKGGKMDMACMKSLSLSLSLSLISFVFRNIKLAYIARKIALIQHDVKDTDIEFMTDFYRHFID